MANMVDNNGTTATAAVFGAGTAPPGGAASSDGATSSTATSPPTLSEPKPEQVKRKFHYGIVNVSDGKCRPQPARLKVCSEFLVLQREEFIFPDEEDGYPADDKFRNVRLKRHPDGGLGFSVKGGVEHNLPILVSKVCRNEDDDHLYIGDAILKVNHRSLGAVTHDEALDLLRGAGDQVSLTVKHYKSAAPFLLKQLRQMIPEMDDAAKEEFLAQTPGGSIRRRRCSSGDRQCSIESPASDGSASWNGVIPRVRRKYVDVVEVPLMMAYVTRYIFGTDKLRANSFEVRGMNGSNTGVIHVADLAVLSKWMKIISEYTNALSGQKRVAFNLDLPPTDQITYMSWVAEGVLNRNQPWQNWKPKYFALRGDTVTIFEHPPQEIGDWPGGTGDAEPRVQSYKVYEAMFRVIKESENVDERHHCFLIQIAAAQQAQVGYGAAAPAATESSMYFAMETRAELLRLESAWHRSVCTTISQIGSKTFHVVYKNIPAAFTIDWIDGFLLKPFASPTYHFVYGFSQLKGSSDDGKATLSLQFQEAKRPGMKHNLIKDESMICPKLQDLLFYMHAFLTAKVASMDPAFLNQGNI